jgi:hypothetical protein
MGNPAHLFFYHRLYLDPVRIPEPTDQRKYKHIILNNL